LKQVTNPRRKPLKPEEAAEMMGKPVGTPNNWRYRNYGPVYFKMGASVRYLEDDVLAFMEKHRIEPTESTRYPKVEPAEVWQP
jgi:hypothetical protein